MKITKLFLSCLVVVIAVPVLSSWLQAASVAEISLYKGKDRQSKIEEGQGWSSGIPALDRKTLPRSPSFSRSATHCQDQAPRLTSERALQRYLTDFRPTTSSQILSYNDFQMELPRRKGTLQALHSIMEKYGKRFLQPRAFGWRAG
jgi:hypothetical protein